MPRLSPSALRQRLAQGDADILDRVVVVDVQIALGACTSRSISAWRASWSSMWSKKPTPVRQECSPVPSRSMRTERSVSLVLRLTSALRTASASFGCCAPAYTGAAVMFQARSMLAFCLARASARGEKPGEVADVHGYAEFRLGRRDRGAARPGHRRGRASASRRAPPRSTARTDSRPSFGAEMGALGLLGDHGARGVRGGWPRLSRACRGGRGDRPGLGLGRAELRRAFESLRQPDQAERERRRSGRSTCRVWCRASMSARWPCRRRARGRTWCR